MSEDSRRVLEMLSSGKITVAEADQLLQALAAGKTEEPKIVESEPEKGKTPHYLRIQVTPVPGGGSKHKGPVNIRLPLGFLRSGIKLAAVMPVSVQDRLNDRFKEQGMDINIGKMKGEDVDKLVNSLSELSMDIDSEKEKVRIFCE